MNVNIQQSRTVFPNLFWFAAPLVSIEDIWQHPKVVYYIKITELQLLEAPMAPAQGTLVCRGTPVGNHWSRRYNNKWKRNSIVGPLHCCLNWRFCVKMYQMRCLWSLMIISYDTILSRMSWPFKLLKIIFCQQTIMEELKD